MTILFVTLYTAGVSLMGLAILGTLRRRKLLNKHLITSRRYQLASLEALKDGDWRRHELLVAAAQEELDRAEYYNP